MDIRKPMSDLYWNSLKKGLASTEKKKDVPSIPQQKIKKIKKKEDKKD